MPAVDLASDDYHRSKYRGANAAQLEFRRLSMVKMFNL